MLNPYRVDYTQKLNFSVDMNETMQTLVASAYDSYLTVNNNLHPVRRVPENAIHTIVAREGGKDSLSAGQAILTFLSNLEHPATAKETPHNDLLPQGHPRARYRGAESFIRPAIADFSSSDLSLDEETRELIRLAIMHPSDSATHSFSIQALTASGVTPAVFAIISQAEEAIARRTKNNVKE